MGVCSQTASITSLCHVLIKYGLTGPDAEGWARLARATPDMLLPTAAAGTLPGEAHIARLKTEHAPALVPDTAVTAAAVQGKAVVSALVPQPSQHGEVDTQTSGVAGSRGVTEEEGGNGTGTVTVRGPMGMVAATGQTMKSDIFLNRYERLMEHLRQDGFAVRARLIAWFKVREGSRMQVSIFHRRP